MYGHVNLSEKHKAAITKEVAAYVADAVLDPEWGEPLKDCEVPASVPEELCDLAHDYQLVALEKVRKHLRRWKP